MNIRISQKKEKKLSKVVVVAFLLVLFSTLIYLVAVEKAYQQHASTPEVQEIQKYFSEKESLPTFTKTVKASDIHDTQPVQNILIVGSDSRTERYEGRSDVLVVMQINPQTEKINLVSIPRDTRTEIVGRNHKDKINHAFSYGIETSVETVENFLDIEINGYVQFNFKSFVHFIDTIGGVEVASKLSFTEQDSSDNRNAIRIEEGVQTLDGEQALAYARMRKQDVEGDIGRGKRQQEIIQSVISKMATPASVVSTIKEIPNLIPYFITSYQPYQLVDMLTRYSTKNWTYETAQLRGSGTKIDGVYYYEPIPESLMEIKELLNTEQDQTETNIE